MAVQSTIAVRKRTLTNEDYWRLKTVSEARLSRDGKQVAYTVHWLDEDADMARSAIFLLDLESGNSRQLTRGEGSAVATPTSGGGGGQELSGGDSQPRWSPDNRTIAYVSTADGPPQLFVQSIDGGAPKRITDESGGAFFPAWSADGKRLAYLSAVPSDAHLVDLETEWLDRHPDIARTSPRLSRVTTLKWRLEGRGFIDSRTHIFVVDADGSHNRQLTSGDFDDGPPAWSPDGTEIAFSADREPDADRRLTNNLWIVNTESVDLRRLNVRKMQEIHSLAFSPDSRRIAFYGSPDLAEKGYFQGMHLWVISREGGDDTNVSARLDRQSGQIYHEHMGIFPLEPPAWTPDGSALFFHATDHGDEAIFHVDLQTGESRRISQGHTQARAPQLTPDGQSVICVVATPTRPFDVGIVPTAGGPITPLTDTNSWLTAGVDLPSPEHISFKGADGWDIEGWLLEPLDHTPGSSYPLILHVHGGPYIAWGNTFYFQFQALAAAGFAALYINPRGSAGYGQAFTSARDYGEKDFRDLMLGVDAVLEQGEADPGRLAVTGLSFGGFMTNWIVTQTDRFKAALTVNGISSWMTKFASSDIMALWQGVEWNGSYWDSDELWEVFRRRSPITYINSIKTPLMLFGSEGDLRVPIEQ